MILKELWCVNPVHLDGVPQTWFNKNKCDISLESGVVFLRTKKMTIGVPLTNVASMWVDPEDPKAKAANDTAPGKKAGAAA